MRPPARPGPARPGPVHSGSARLAPARFGPGCRVALLGALALLGACAAKPPANDPEARAEFRQNNDPFEPANRLSYRVDTALDANLLKPAAQAYAYVLPQPVRNGLHNVLSNITNPVLFANDVVQTKPRRAGDTFMRFLINSSVGVLGIFDVASDLGYAAHDSGFGTTLALWGVPAGPFLFLPVLGPSNPRDAAGLAGDAVLDPFTYASFGGDRTLGGARYGLGVLDTRDRVGGELDTIDKTALDPYATFRSLYQQHRTSEIDRVRGDDRATTPDWFTSATPTPAQSRAPAEPGPKPDSPAQVGAPVAPGVE